MKTQNSNSQKIWKFRSIKDFQNKCYIRTTLYPITLKMRLYSCSAASHWNSPQKDISKKRHLPESCISIGSWVEGKIVGLKMQHWTRPAALDFDAPSHTDVYENMDYNFCILKQQHSQGKGNKFLGCCSWDHALWSSCIVLSIGTLSARAGAKFCYKIKSASA